MKKKDYLLNEDGSIRNCDSNIARMNLWEVIKVSHIGLDIDWKEYALALVSAISIPLYLVTFPVCVFIRAYFQRKRAKKNVKEYLDNQKKM